MTPSKILARTATPECDTCSRKSELLKAPFLTVSRPSPDFGFLHRLLLAMISQNSTSTGDLRPVLST